MSELAVDGGTPIRSKRWPTWPVVRASLVAKVSRVAASGKWWRYSGDNVTKFEKQFAAYHDANHGIAVTSGTTALELALKSAGIGPGDEVVVPPITFIATATSVVLVNAVPVFADIDEKTFNLDPTKAEAAITPRTKAIIVVHYGGYPADMSKFIKLARKHKLILIEDCAHAHGAIWKDRKIGALGDLGAFSFQESKNLTCGEGGIVLTNSNDLAEKALSIQTFGRIRGKGFYYHENLGHNFRMTEFQGAVLLEQLRFLEKETEKRRSNANYLSAKLAEIPGIKLPKSDDPRITRRAYHMYIFRYQKEFFRNMAQEEFIAALTAEGIPCAKCNSPIYRNPVFQNNSFWPHGCPLTCNHYKHKLDYRKVKCPVAERVYGESVFFTQNMLLGTRRDMDDIIKAINKLAG